MTFSFDDSLAPELYPLSWLLGSWRGFGILAAPASAERNIVAEMDFAQEGGLYLKVTTALFTASPRPVERDWPGSVGYEALEKESLWSTETAYWRCSQVEQGEQAARAELEVVTADPSGHLALFLGVAEGPRVTLATDAVIAAPAAAQLSAAQRLYGLVASDLLFAWDIAAGGGELAPYASGRLSRQ